MTGIRARAPIMRLKIKQMVEKYPSRAASLGSREIILDGSCSASWSSRKSAGSSSGLHSGAGSDSAAVLTIGVLHGVVEYAMVRGLRPRQTGNRANKRGLEVSMLQPRSGVTGRAQTKAEYHGALSPVPGRGIENGKALPGESTRHGC
jgi:hypothetical protein